ncbi:MAG: hypothetical protein QM734_13455 [Cyclobacteriaceae bacterium]
MSEHLVKHTRKAFSIFRLKDMGWKHKASELLFEVFIIVVAVSISLLLERWREKSLDREHETEFLEGLKTDLISDIEEMRGDSVSYMKLMKAYGYFIRNAKKPMDSAQFYINSIYSAASFQANSSRFEGLKSSGKLDIIEDSELRNRILLFYQENIPSLVSSTEIFLTSSRNPLVDVLDHELNFESKEKLSESISTTMSRLYPQNILMSRKGFIDEILSRYQVSLKSAREIVHRIEEKEHKE